MGQLPSSLRQTAANWRQAMAAQWFQKQPLSRLEHTNCAAKPLAKRHILDLVTIAFNNPWVIAEQIRLLNKNLRDDFTYTVVDNSSDYAARQQISQLCAVAKVGYIALPTNPYRDASQNHGAALNWAYWNFITPRQADYFGFLDHDVFPARATSLIPLIKSIGLAGHPQQREERWYLWAGFCFFSRQLVANRPLNFRPIAGLDSGGGNWPVLYSHIDMASLPKFKHSYEHLRGGDDPQADLIERFGDWIHTINASGWKPAHGKAGLVQNYLAQL